MSKTLIIAMAYGGRPLERLASGKGEAVTFLVAPSEGSAAGDSALKGVGFPDSACFQHDSNLFRLLKDAYERRDERELQALWAKARPLQPA